MPIRRINVLSGPGAGKSTLASWLSSEITISGHKIQYVDEVVKKWAWQGKVPKSFDQCYLFAKQMYKEDSLLYSGVDLIISDCPLLMVCAYVKINNLPFLEELLSLTRKFDSQYPSINIFLDRGDIPYKEHGRYETYEQALEVDAIILKTMEENLPSFIKSKTRNRQELLNQLLDTLGRKT